MSPSEPAPSADLPSNAFAVAERVRWEDVDLVGIVRYSAYTRFLDVVEAELFRAIGLGHPRGVDDFRIWLVRRVLHVEYHAPARFDALLQIRAWIGRIGRTSVTLHFEVGDEAGTGRHVAGHVVLVAVDADTLTSRELPTELVARLGPYTV